LARYLGRLSLLFALGIAALPGCGGTNIQEGPPKNVDMTKDYSPKVEMPGMSPKMQSEAAQKKATGGTP